MREKAGETGGCAGLEELATPRDGGQKAESGPHFGGADRGLVRSTQWSLTCVQ